MLKLVARKYRNHWIISRLALTTVSFLGWMGWNCAMAAQPGKALPGFSFVRPAGGDGCQVDSLGLQSSGNLVVGGQFLQGGTAAKAVGLLDSNGNMLTNFTLAADNSPHVTVRGDNAIWVSYLASGGATNVVRRYLPDLTADTSFSASCQVYNEALCQLSQDDRLIVGGAIQKDAQSSQVNLVRINADGALDNWRFYPSSESLSRVTQLAMAPRGYFYEAGEVAQADGSMWASVRRHHPDYGELESDFSFVAGANGAIKAMVVDVAGRVIIGGDFTEVQGAVRPHIARLLANGQLDHAFDPGAGADAPVACLALQANGKIIAGGEFAQVAGVARRGIARFNANGTLDTLFDPGTGIDGGTQFPQPKVMVMAFRAAGELLIGGEFEKYNGAECNSLVLIDAGEAETAPAYPGSLDQSFVHAGANVIDITAVYPQPNGRIIATGLMDFGLLRPYIYVWQTDAGGTWTTAGDILIDEEDTCGVTQPDGKVLFSSYTSLHSSNPIVRYTLDFNQDATFSSPGCGPFEPGNCNFGGQVLCLGVQQDGKILVGGILPPYKRARLNADGSMDSTFHKGLESDKINSISLLAVQADDYVIIAGEFSQLDGLARKQLARLQPDGYIDPTFDAGAGADGTIRAMQLDRAGRLLIAGDFTTVQGVPRGRVARLLSNGQLDATFDPGTGPDDSVYCLAIQANGKICLGGSFTNVNGALCNRIARLNADGTRDASFVTGSGVEDGKVVSLGLQANGDIIIGGTFSVVEGVACAKLVRIHGDPIVARPRLAGWQKDGEGFRFEVQGQAKGSYAVQTSTNLVDWQTSTNIVLDGGALPLTNSLPAGDCGFYRLISQ